MNTLFRPVGLHELALIWDAEMRAFPPRLPHQPIFYPVANIEYARQVALGWNTKDTNSGFAGFVTAFDLDENYLSKLEPHTVGGSGHVEYWVPADELAAFNRAILGQIRVGDTFFGDHFTGDVPQHFELAGKDAATQFAALFKSWDYSRMDVTCEVSANRKSVYLNWLFWHQRDFSGIGISVEARDGFLEQLRKVWEYNRIAVPLPPFGFSS